MADMLGGISGTEGGIGGLLLGILAFLGKQYLDARRDKREDAASERQTESGIVETTKDTLATVREELKNMRADRAEDRALITELKGRVEEVESENGELRRELDELRYGPGSARSPRDEGYAYGSPGWVPPGERRRPGRGAGEGGERARRRYRDD